MTTLIDRPGDPHRTRLVRHPQDGTVPIDEALADLVGLLWRLGIDTISSCQDVNGKGTAQIALVSWEQTEIFLSIAAGEYSEEIESLYNRIVLGGGFLPRYHKRWRTQRCSQVEAWAWDLHRDYDENDKPVIIGAPLIERLPSVFFPASDIPEVEARLRVAA